MMISRVDYSIVFSLTTHMKIVICAFCRKTKF